MAPAAPVMSSAIIVYLATDKSSLRQTGILPVLLNVTLIYVDNQTHIVHSGVVNVTCTTTGFLYAVTHDLTTIPKKTKGWQICLISIFSLSLSHSLSLSLSLSVCASPCTTFSVFHSLPLSLHTCIYIQGKR